MCSRGLRFLADVVLANHFGEQVFGRLSLAQTLAIQAMGLSTCGLDTAGAREVAQRAVSAQSLAATIVALRLGLGLIGWGTLAVVALVIPQFQSRFQLAVLYGLSIFSGALTVGWVAQGRGRFNVVGLAALATHLGYFCGIGLAAQAGWPPVCVPLLLVLSETLTALGLWIWMLRTIGPAAHPLPLGASLKLLRDSVPIGLANYLRLLTIGSDLLLLGLFATTDAELGQYGVGFRLYSAGISVLSVYFVVLLPHLAKHATESPRVFKSALYTSLQFSLAVVGPLTVVGWLFAGFILHLLFPRASDAAANVCQVLMLAVSVNLIAGHFRTAFVARGRQRLDFALVAVGAVVHVAAKLVLIPLLGMIGAAWGTVVGEIVLMLLAWNACRTALRDDA
jgi:O-antigen/teichoic acid export membrane protein